MNWLSRVRNAIASVTQKDTPDNLWHKCPGCGQMVFTKEFEENLSVCPSCDHHGRIGARTRFRQVFDDGQFTLFPAPRAPEDPLKFRDSKKYVDRLKAARAATDEPDALLNARGTISGHQAIVGVQDFAFMGGSMGVGVGEAFIAGIHTAIAERLPYIVFTASGGARMQEGILSLMQMPRMTVAVAELKEAGLPYIVVLTDPTSGGVMASYALIGDVHLAEPKATLAFTGRRVIENTIREKLPEGFQTSEYLLDHGMLDMIVHRRELPQTLGRLLAYVAPVKAAA
jgi:acetyl-CoA carboxylase carboxyl transferase subunit beta